MRRTLPLFLTAALLAAAPVAADDLPTMEERLGNTLMDMLDRMAPHLENLQREMQPALDEMQDMMQHFSAIDDPRHYAMPEVLPNGDIIIRRREDAPAYRAPDADRAEDTAPETKGAIDL